MPLSNKFFTKFNGKNSKKIDRSLTKIWTKCNSLLFWATLYYVRATVDTAKKNFVAPY